MSLGCRASSPGRFSGGDWENQDFSETWYRFIVLMASYFVQHCVMMLCVPALAMPRPIFFPVKIHDMTGSTIMHLATITAGSCKESAGTLRVPSAWKTPTPAMGGLGFTFRAPSVKTTAEANSG